MQHKPLATCRLQAGTEAQHLPTLQVFVLWGCFLGLQLGKSRFPRCSAPYFTLFAVQVRTPISRVSHAEDCQQLSTFLHVPACASAQCQRLCPGAWVQHLFSLLTKGAELQSQNSTCCRRRCLWPQTCCSRTRRAGQRQQQRGRPQRSQCFGPRCTLQNLKFKFCCLLA
jgi:hypothetical protein